MKKLQNGGSFIRGLAASLGLLACVTAAHGAAYVGNVTNIVLGGSNYIQFVLNEGTTTATVGGNPITNTVTITTVTYPSHTTNVMTNVAAGINNFFIGSDLSYTISTFKQGNGVPFQIGSDANSYTVWNGGVTLRGIAVQTNPKIASAFGDVYIGATGNGPSRQWGITGVTTDLGHNAFFGGTSTNAVLFATASTTVFANDVVTGNGGFGSGPFHLYVADDGTVYCTDSTTGNANCFYFDPLFQTTNTLFSITGQNAGQAANQHGNINDIAITGSIATGDLQVWTADNGLYVPSYMNSFPNILGNGGVGNFGSIQTTFAGDANEIYRYTIGNGALPTTNTPDWAVTLILDGGFQNSQNISVAVGPNTNYVYAGARRSNFSDGCIQVFRRSDGVRVYTSLRGTPQAQIDLFTVPNSSVANNGVFTTRISPDGKYLGAGHANSALIICNLTNGIPDESSLFTILNPTQAATGRQMAWDAADNIYMASSGQALVRGYDLGTTATTVYSNDITGTNGSFQLILPPANATIVNDGDASQNYGTPIQGNFKVDIGTSSNVAPVTVSFSISGTATNRVNYNIVTNAALNGIVIATNAGNVGTITFPAGVMPGGGNWRTEIPLAPTASPLYGPTLRATLTLSGGTNYSISSPVAATVNIANTGPQYLFVSAAPIGTNMSRSITGDYAEFVINRWGDTNGPSNSVGNINAHAYTITNFTLAGTANFTNDYTAGVQRFVTGGSPTDGSPGVQINPGEVSITVMVGNPIKHTNVIVAATNLTILPGLTNISTTTNLTASDGTTYVVTTATTTLNELDNAIGVGPTGGEVVLWSDPLTNASASYAVTFASTNLSTNVVLPVYIPNYQYTNGGAPNGSAANFPGNSNCFDVMLGFPIANENAFEQANNVPSQFAYSPPVSPVMAEQGWSNAMRLSVNKQFGSQPTICGVNVFPTTQQFTGNYALRFDMYLSVWSQALTNFNPGAFPRQFAAFGINTQGTNCDWRMSIAAGIATNTGSGPTNADGMWFCIDAGDQALTPADFDAFVSPPFPNQGTSDIVSGTAQSMAGVFKRPPFPGTDGASAGTPINQWVNVSVELTGDTNVQIFIDRTKVLANFAVTNIAGTFPSTLAPGPGLWTNGVPMFGYLQPFSSQSDESAFVYFSNARIVELGPYIVTQPTNVNGLLPTLLFAGTNITYNWTASASYSQPGLTNVWYRGTTAPTIPLSTNSTVGTNLTDSLTVAYTNIQNGSNYWVVFSDSAGSTTSFVQNVMVIQQVVTNGAAVSNATATLRVVTNGSTFCSFTWRTNGGLIVGNSPSKYVGTNSPTLTISNLSAADTLWNYTCVITNALTNMVSPNLFFNLTAQSLTTAVATVSIITQPTNAVVSPAAQTNIWGSSANFTVSAGGSTPSSYVWRKDGTNLVGNAKYSGTNAASLTISNVTRADNGSYTAILTNAAGSSGVSSAGALTVVIPPPTMSTVSVSGGNVSMNFTSTNGFDTSNAFTLLSATVVSGPYTNAVGATFSGSAGAFSVTVPQTTDSHVFYRLLHSN